jgi:uncharacterized UBP type Zn finger protein
MAGFFGGLWYRDELELGFHGCTGSPSAINPIIPRVFLNMGNTCYFNSLLQVLVHSKLFTQAVLPIATEDMAETTRHEFLIKEWIDLLRDVNADSSSEIAPMNLFNAMSLWKPDLFLKGQGQDAHEVLTAVQTALAEAVSLVTGARFNLFDLSLTHPITCDASANQVASNIETETGLFLSPYGQPDGVSVSCLVEQYFALEIIDHLEACNGQSATRRAKLVSLPRILVLSVHRNIGPSSPKVLTSIKLDANLYFSSFSEGSVSANYRLSGVVNHHGPNVDQGHYKATIRVEEDWYEADDSVVTNLGELPENSRNAVILTYELVN